MNCEPLGLSNDFPLARWLRTASLQESPATSGYVVLAGNSTGTRVGAALLVESGGERRQRSAPFGLVGQRMGRDFVREKLSVAP